MSIPPLRLSRRVAPSPVLLASGAATRAARGRHWALALALVGALLVSDGSVNAGDVALDLSADDTTAAPADETDLGDVLAAAFARFDQSIRSVTVATDRAASHALEAGLGSLAVGEDRRMTAHAESALAAAPAAAQRHFELASVDAPPPGRLARRDSRPVVRTPAEPHPDDAPPAAPLDR